MAAMGKRERFHRAAEALGCLRCPVCGGPLERRGDDLACPAGHTVNVNRKGCINVLSRQAEGCYTAELFAARSRVLASGCYEPVARAIEACLPEGEQRLLDAGCGEGWYLNRLLTAHPGRQGIGVDISRDAILRATDQPCGAVWCVADLRRLPVADSSLTAVLDILTPAAYDEFARVLAPEGVLIKVYPGREYLRELREARSLPLYEDGAVDAYLREKAQLLRQERVTVKQPVDAALWEAFVRMTPLNQDLPEEEKRRIAASPAEAVTLDLHIACARLRKI